MAGMRAKAGMLLLVSLLVTTTGCFNKSVTGPTWTTKFAVPLIMRTRNVAEPAKSSQLMLGNGTNGLGEKGLGLTDASNYALPEESWESAPLGMLSMGINPITSLDLTAVLSGVPLGSSGVLPATDTAEFSFEDSDYQSVTLSNTANRNRITVNLNGMVATGGGLNISFMVDGTAVETVTIAAEQTTGVLSLAGEVLSPGSRLKIRISGNLRKTAATAWVGFAWTTFEAVSFTVDQSLVASKVDYNLASEPIEFSFDLPAEFAAATFGSAMLKLAPAIPPNLVIQGNLVIESNQAQSANIPVTITSGADTNVTITDQLNAILTNAPRCITFRFRDIQLSGSGDVTLSSTDTVRLKMSANLGFTSLATTPQAMAVDAALDTETIETTRLVFEVTNYSPVGLTVAVALYPDNDTNPANAPVLNNSEKISFEIGVNPGSLTSPGMKLSELVVSTTQLRNLIRNGTVYHQITVTNNSGTTPINSQHYLEIRSRAEGRVQVNKP